jgi:RNA-binding protein
MPRKTCNNSPFNSGQLIVDATRKKALKAQAHHLKPVVLLGNKGLTPALIAETNVALEAHELIKVKLGGTEKEDRLPLANTLSSELQADLVQIIGNQVVLYRKKTQG